jgi:hypothetical protein
MGGLIVVGSCLNLQHAADCGKTLSNLTFLYAVRWFWIMLTHH